MSMPARPGSDRTRLRITGPRLVLGKHGKGVERRRRNERHRRRKASITSVRVKCNLLSPAESDSSCRRDTRSCASPVASACGTMRDLQLRVSSYASGSRATRSPEQESLSPPFDRTVAAHLARARSACTPGRAARLSGFRLARARTCPPSSCKASRRSLLTHTSKHGGCSRLGVRRIERHDVGLETARQLTSSAAGRDDPLPARARRTSNRIRCSSRGTAANTYDENRNHPPGQT